RTSGRRRTGKEQVARIRNRTCLSPCSFLLAPTSSSSLLDPSFCSCFSLPASYFLPLLRAPCSFPRRPIIPSSMSSALSPDLSHLPRVDQVGIEERAVALGKRSIKKSAKQRGIRLAISMLDLTTLEGKDSEGKVRQLCQKAMRPMPGDPS